MTTVRVAWTDPEGQEWESPVDGGLNEASREERRLRRVGCTNVRVLTDPRLLRGPSTNTVEPPTLVW